MKKYLKFLVVAVLTVVMMTTLTGCGGKGKFVIDHAEAMGMTVTPEDVGFVGSYIELKALGRGYAKIGNNEGNIKWSKDKIEDASGKYDYTIEGDTLTIEATGVKLVFKKQ